MITYAAIAVATVVTTCSECGANVARKAQPVHTAWHERLAAD